MTLCHASRTREPPPSRAHRGRIPSRLRLGEYGVWHGFVFFFSSRRRHTRFDCDWSSDVCSSDLGEGIAAVPSVSREDLFLQTKFTLPSGQDPNNIPYDVKAPLEDQVCQSFAKSLKNRSEEHTSELQSQSNLVCRLLLEKKNKMPP